MICEWDLNRSSSQNNRCEWWDGFCGRGDLLPRCQMGKIKYRHETGRHQGNKRNTAGRESESQSQSQERNVSFTPLTFFRQFGRKALTSSWFMTGEQSRSSDTLVCSNSNTLLYKWKEQTNHTVLPDYLTDQYSSSFLVFRVEDRKGISWQQKIMLLLVGTSVWHFRDPPVFREGQTAASSFFSLTDS